jgi:hypothetical protein
MKNLHKFIIKFSILSAIICNQISAMWYNGADYQYSWSEGAERRATVQDANDACNLYEAAAQGDLEAVMAFVESGADVNQPNEKGFTALSLAVDNNHVSIAEYLLQREGTDPNKLDVYGYTLLHQAISAPMVKLLLENGADFTMKSTTGNTPLHYAAMRGYEDIARLLLLSGADPSHKNPSRKLNALDLAKKYKHEEVVKVLRNFTQYESVLKEAFMNLTGVDKIPNYPHDIINLISRYSFTESPSNINVCGEATLNRGSYTFRVAQERHQQLSITNDGSRYGQAELHSSSHTCMSGGGPYGRRKIQMGRHGSAGLRPVSDNFMKSLTEYRQDMLNRDALLKQINLNNNGNKPTANQQ